jgi:hypothetical protein
MSTVVGVFVDAHPLITTTAKTAAAARDLTRASCCRRAVDGEGRAEPRG